MPSAGLTTRQIAQAYLVPEATMAQRISRAKRHGRRAPVDQPGDLATVMRVLYLVFNEGYSGDVDLAAEAIRLTRQLARWPIRPTTRSTAGLLALMLLHHARRPARTPARRQPGAARRAGPLPLGHLALIAEGVAVLQAALARDRLGPVTRPRPRSPPCTPTRRALEETDWVQIVGWYDDLLRLTGSPVVALNRAVAVGEADGAAAGLAALSPPWIPACPASAWPGRGVPAREAGDLATAARLYADATPLGPQPRRTSSPRPAGGAEISQALRG